MKFTGRKLYNILRDAA